MNIPQDDLNAWARSLFSANSLIGHARQQTTRGETDAAAATLDDARRRVWLVVKALEVAGADWPAPHPPKHETPLELLDTPASRRYVRTLREAWEARQEVDRERGLEDGPAEVLESWLRDAETEVYGPTGRGEGAERRDE